MRSSNVAVTIPNDANSVPERFTAAPDGDGDVDLSWTAPDNGASEYVIYRNGVEQARTSGLGYTVSNPTSGTSWWQISAVSTGGTEGARTPSIPVDVDDQNPSAPTGLAGTVTNGAITLTWNTSSDNVAATHYQVYRNGQPVITTTNPTLTITNPHAGDGYWQISGTDAQGNEGNKTPPLLITI